MTLDLFADDTIGAAPAPAPAPKPASEPARESFPMTPIVGKQNRWLYKGEIVTYDAHRKHAAVGRWATVEGIGKPIIHSDDHAEVCRGIDARQKDAAPVSYVDCGECPMSSTGCAGKCMRAAS